MTSSQSSNEPEINVDTLFYAVLCGLIANGGTTDDWIDVYRQAKVGAQTIYACIVEDALNDELLEAQKDLHGR